MDRRALPGLFAGLAGCSFGILAALTGSPILAVVTAACALSAGASSLSVLQRARQAERRAAMASAELVTIREIELATPNRSRSLVDLETGLADGRFFELALETRVSAARRQLWPVTVVLVEVGIQNDFRRREALAGLAVLVRQTLRECDLIARIGVNTLGIVLDDTNEAGGAWAAERLQIELARNRGAVDSFAAGVASYPTHGLDADEVLRQARAALARACATEPGHGLGHVEVARLEA
jgi:GGDEF domain-containing protein